MNRVLGILAAATALATATPAMALVSVGQDYIFDWTGNCQDCAERAETEAFPVSGTLRLTNYELGSVFTNANFVSFTYNGSNLLNPYTIDFFAFLGGSLDGSGAGSIFIQGFEFSSRRQFSFFQSEGLWNTGQVNIDDFGNQGTWTLQTAAVPEPASWALMIAGFGLVGAAMRRRKPVVSVTYA